MSKEHISIKEHNAILLEFNVKNKQLINRVQELEDLINTHAPHGRNYTNEQYVGLLQQNKRYCRALEFYAKGKHYHAEGYPNTRLITNDYGDVARKALESESHE